VLACTASAAICSPLLNRACAPLTDPEGWPAVFDAAARRVLPGHLLRRSRILSSLRVGGQCLQRVAVTACSGEELVLAW
jgi:hypothetical protein